MLTFCVHTGPHKNNQLYVYTQGLLQPNLGHFGCLSQAKTVVVYLVVLTCEVLLIVLAIYTVIVDTSSGWRSVTFLINHVSGADTRKRLLLQL